MVVWITAFIGGTELENGMGFFCMAFRETKIK